MRKYRDANIRSNWYYSIFFPVVEILFSICIGLLVWYGCKRILSDQQLAGLSAHHKGVTPGTVLEFISFVEFCCFQAYPSTG
jgi:ATP-binding cassette subfamily B multidrug efflux pump